MKNLVWAAIVVTGLASCAATTASDSAATRYQCNNGMQAALSHQGGDSATLTLSQVTGGNVEARSLNVTRLSHPGGEAWNNAAEQTQWVDLGSNVELTYPVDGVVRLFTCRRATS